MKSTESLPQNLLHGTLHTTVIHANRFILTVPFQSHFGHLPVNGPRAFSHLKSSTHSAFPEKSHTAAYTPKHRASLLPPCGAFSFPFTHGQRKAGGSGCTPTACARFFRRRNPAGLRDLFHFYRNCSLYALCLGFSAHTRWGWYRCPRCALHVLRTLGARLSKRLICRFLRLGDYH